MESEPASWPDYYGKLRITVFAPKKYYKTSIKSDDYSAKIVWSKKRDWSDFFYVEIKKVFSGLPFQPDLIVVVPASQLSCFSPTLLSLAEKLAILFRIKHEDVLIRVKVGKKLTECNSCDERYASIKDSFKTTRKLSGERVVLLDDTRATGMTLLECAKTLKAAGASDITAVCLGINSEEV